MKEESKDFNKGVAGVRKIRLSSREREELKGRLLENIISNSREFSPKRTYTIFEYVRMHHSFTYSVSAVLVAVLIGGGTVFAAEEALPGDVLYPVKIYVNEPVRSAVAVTPTATLEWETKKIERRLEEAETLASRGDLDEETRIDLEENFDKSADKFALNLEKVREEDDSEDIVVEAEIKYEARIRAHSKVLERIEEFSSDDKKEEIANIRRKVASRSRGEASEEDVTVVMAFSMTEAAPVAIESFEQAGAEDVSRKSGPSQDLDNSDSDEDKDSDSRQKFRFNKKEIEKIVKDTEDKLRGVREVRGPVQGAIFDDSWKKVKEAKGLLEEVKDEGEDMKENKNEESDSSGQDFTITTEPATDNRWSPNKDWEKTLRDARSAAEEADVSFKQGQRLGDEKDDEKNKKSWKNWGNNRGKDRSNNENDRDDSRDNDRD